MRFLVIFTIILLSMQACSQRSNDNFVDKIANDFSRNSYFIVLSVKLSEGITICLVENDELFYYFNKTKGYDESKYKKEVGAIIRENKILSITEADFSNFGFNKIVKTSKFDEEVKKGKDFIVGKYFKNRVIVDGVSDNERNTLIKLLFDWGITSRIDDETGYLIIDK